MGAKPSIQLSLFRKRVERKEMRLECWFRQVMKTEFLGVRGNTKGVELVFLRFICGILSKQNRTETGQKKFCSIFTQETDQGRSV